MYAICSIFKNHQNNLRDWLTFHVAQGFDTFYLYNDNSTDNFVPCIEGFNVILTDIPVGADESMPYEDCINKSKYEHWVAFIDVNEYLYSNKTRFTTQLSTFEELHIAGIGVNLMVYGEKNKESPTPLPVIQTATLRDKTINEHIKFIIRPSFCEFSQHGPLYFKLSKGNYIVNENFQIITDPLANKNLCSADNLRVNHYINAHSEDTLGEHFITNQTEQIEDNSAVENFNTYKTSKNTKIFQVFYDKASAQRLDEKLIAYPNKNTDNYFENSVILDIYNKKIDCEYVGVTSWRLKEKTNFYAQDLLDHVDNTGADVIIYLTKYPFVTQIANMPIDIWKSKLHTTTDIYKASKLLNDSGVLPIDIFAKEWTTCFCNYWIAKKEVFDKYVETILAPAIKWMQENKDTLAQFKFTNRGNKNYPIETFVLEGLFGSFLAHNNYNVKVMEQRFDKTDDVWHDAFTGQWKARLNGVVFDVEACEDGTLKIKGFVAPREQKIEAQTT